MATLMSEMCRGATAADLDTLIADSVQYWTAKGYAKKEEVKADAACAGMSYLRTAPTAHPDQPIDEPTELFTAILIFEKV